MSGRRGGRGGGSSQAVRAVATALGMQRHELGALLTSGAGQSHHGQGGAGGKPTEPPPLYPALARSAHPLVLTDHTPLQYMAEIKAEQVERMNDQLLFAPQPASFTMRRYMDRYKENPGAALAAAAAAAAAADTTANTTVDTTITTVSSQPSPATGGKDGNGKARAARTANHLAAHFALVPNELCFRATTATGSAKAGGGGPAAKRRKIGVDCKEDDEEMVGVEMLLAQKWARDLQRARLARLEERDRAVGDDDDEDRKSDEDDEEVAERRAAVAKARAGATGAGDESDAAAGEGDDLSDDDYLEEDNDYIANYFDNGEAYADGGGGSDDGLDDDNPL